MTDQIHDITPYIQARSDQLNADDLAGGPITVQITEVRRGSDEQPVAIRISGGHAPWRPCKTSLRILAAAWGTDPTAWVGRWVTLYRDESVRFGGAQVGGIRPCALSHLDRELSLSLAESRGKKRQHRIRVLRAPEQQGAPTADLTALLEQAGVTVEQVDAWRHKRGRGPVADLSDEERAHLAAWLAADPARLEAVRAVEVGDE